MQPSQPTTQTETPESRANLANAIRGLQAKGDTNTINQLVTAYKAKYQATKPSLSPGSQFPTPTLEGVGKVVNSIFPGKQVGEAIGTLGGLGVTAAKEKLGLAPKGSTSQYDTTAPTPLQVAGDIGQGALMVAAPNIGNGATVAGRIGANATLGAGIGATGAIKEGQKPSEVLKQAAIGGAIGGGASALGEGTKALAENLPKWLTKAALPKIDNKNIDYAIENTKIGGLKSIAKKSSDSISNYENQVQGVLSHPEFKNVAIDTNSVLDSAISKFPNSQYTPQDLIKNAENIAPNVGKLIQKMDAGQVNIQELNSIRKELDAATKSVYISLNRPPEAKLLGASLANSIRDYVQSTAPETAPIFSNYSKEIGLNKAIQAAIKKGETKVSFRDVVAAGAGFTHSGLTGALEALLLERGLSSSAGQLIAAKGIDAASKVAIPAVSTAFQGLKAPIIKKITGGNKK